MARLSGMSHNTIGRIARGKVLPDLGTVARLEVTLQTSLWPSALWHAFPLTPRAEHQPSPDGVHPAVHTRGSTRPETAGIRDGSTQDAARRDASPDGTAKPTNPPGSDRLTGTHPRPIHNAPPNETTTDSMQE
ncbi:multiprotein-bridging factor 1 family protein [Streptomyces sp. NPDC015032]|uniref:helix-turn-helix domain-containing protein n=1 Tax=Streptomyces sp. NPDC015032 TaxID=3364937 RepID=UPI0036FCDF52